MNEAQTRLDKIDPKLRDTIISTVQKYGISTERVTSFEHFPDPKDVVFYEVEQSGRQELLIHAKELYQLTCPS